MQKWNRYQRIFWLALIEQAAAVASLLYHYLVTEDFSGESILLPLIGSGTLVTLVFLHLYQPREEPARGAPAAG